MVIVSRNNPLVKEFSSLKEKKYRKQRGAFLAEGGKMVREAVQKGMRVLRLAVREDYVGETFSLPVTVFGEDAFRAVCDEKTPQGIVAEIEIPVYELRPPRSSCLLLDGVSDPANMGAIVRSANAAGYRELYCIDCADPFSPKSVRASMSGVFSVRIMQGNREEVLSVLSGVPLLAADMSGENIFHFQPPEIFALCIGNEGNGLSREVRERASKTVCIPMEGDAESLNAAVSASVAMYLLKRKHFERS
ncbi:MAG: RNA methyltransferase [Clostridia bacterium]|jgi:TrmH family RNA methyltransferase|nr:RNA methyltransferase [Clostridia bacterium]